MSDNADFAARLAANRLVYIEDLREHLAPIMAFLQQCQAGKLTPEAREAMRALTHKLAGSGGTFGFPAITDTARPLELAIKAEAPASELAPLAVALLQTLQQTTAP